MLKEYIEEKECYRLKQELQENLESYQNRRKEISDKDWLEELLLQRCPHIARKQAQKAAKEIVKSLMVCKENLLSIEQASQKGVSREKWLESRLQESAIGMSPAKYSEILQQAEAILYEQNKELTEALSHCADGHILMNPNLNTLSAEDTLVSPVELQGYLQGKTIKVGVQRGNCANSMELYVKDSEGSRIIESYQMKFGSDAKATIRLIEQETCSNQKIIVPSEQLLKVQEYFNVTDSQKIISDHIEINGVRGNAFTKEELEELCRKTQEEPVITAQNDYYSTKEYAYEIGNHVGIMALQMAAVTTGMDMASKLYQESKSQSNELAASALKSEEDTSVKTIISGTLYTMIQTGGLLFLKNESCKGIANLAFAGIEHAKILLKIAEGKLSALKGLDQMGKLTFSIIGGFGCIALAKEVLTRCPFAGVMGVGIGVVAGMVGYAAETQIGDRIALAAKKLSNHARDLGMKGFHSIKHRTSKVSVKPRLMTFA